MNYFVSKLKHDYFEAHKKIERQELLVGIKTERFQKKDFVN